MVRIEIGWNGIIIDEKEIPLYSGSLHYWRIDPDNWNAVLDKTAALGFEIVSIPVPWSVHELERGEFDFGERDKRNNLSRFLSLCSEKELKVLLCPGPAVNAQLPGSGLPVRILNDPEIQAINNHGNLVIDRYPVPSYASTRFSEEVELYFDAVAPIMEQHQYPNGAVIGIQADHESSYFNQQDYPYRLDYHPDSIWLYRRFLIEKYESIVNLNAGYRAKYESFNEIEPPHGFLALKKEQLPLYFDWIEYKEFQLKWAMVNFARSLRYRGLHRVFFFHNSPGFLPPINTLSFENAQDIALVGLDVRCTKEESDKTAQTALSLCGTSKLPFVSQLAAGFQYEHHWSDFNVTLHDQEFTVLYALMKGVKGFNLEMLADRERWTGAPLYNSGEPCEPYYAFYRKLHRFLYDNTFWLYDKIVSTALVINWDVWRMKNFFRSLNYNPMAGIRFPEAFHLPDPIPGVSGPGRIISWYDEARRVLDDSNIPFNIVSSQIPLQRLKSYANLLVPMANYVNSAFFERMLRFADEGGNVIFGPLFPDLDMNLDKWDLPAKALGFSGPPRHQERAFGVGKVAFCPEEQFDKRLVAFLHEYASPYEVRAGSGIEVQVFHHSVNKSELLFVANPNPDARESRIAFQGRKRFIGLWEKEVIEGNCRIEMMLPPYKARVFIVEKP